MQHIRFRRTSLSHGHAVKARFFLEPTSFTNMLFKFKDTSNIISVVVAKIKAQYLDETGKYVNKTAMGINSKTLQPKDVPSCLS